MNDAATIEDRLRRTYQAVAERTRTDIDLRDPLLALRPTLLVVDDAELPPSDTNGSRDRRGHRDGRGQQRRPDRRAPALLLVAAAAMAVLLGMAVAVLAGSDAGHDVRSGTRPGPNVPTVTIRRGPIPAAPFPGRMQHAAVWAGQEMIVFGGYHDRGTGRDGCDPCEAPVTAAAYDPVARTWRKLADLPVQMRGASTAVWTGKVVVAVLLDDVATAHAPKDPVVATYDPRQDRWRIVSSPHFGALSLRTFLAWTGDRVLVAGFDQELGSDADGPTPAGVDGVATYNPATDTWLRLPDAPVSLTETRGTTLWAGEAMVYVGPEVRPGRTSSHPSRMTAVALDPRRRKWTTLPKVPLEVRDEAFVGWNGREIVVAGGDYEPSNGGDFRSLYDAASYDMRTGRWSKLPNIPVSVSSSYDDDSRLGKDLVAIQTEDLRGRGLLFDAATRSWRYTSATGGKGLAESLDSVVSTGDALLLWGGVDDNGHDLNSGFALTLPG